MNDSIIGEIIDTMANIEYGFLIALVLDAILVFGIASLNSSKKMSVLSYIIAAVLLIPLSFQMSRLVGACQISDTTSAISDIVGLVSPTLSKYVSSVAGSDISWFIFRRIVWTILFMSVAGFGIYATMEKGGNGRGRASLRQERVSSRRGTEHRPSRRRY